MSLDAQSGPPKAPPLSGREVIGPVRRRLGVLPGWRRMTYVILAVNLLMLVWVIAGAATASGNPSDCGTLDAKACNTASDAGTAVGVFLLVVLWAMGDIILGVIWLVTNGRKPAHPEG